jgi:hypothetical protein
MRVDADIPIKALLRGVVHSGPVRRFSRWLHTDSGENISAPSQAGACFVHIPKTGGTFVTQAEDSDLTVIFPMRDLNHSTLVNQDWEALRDVPPPFGEASAIPLSAVDGHVVFSNIRNVFSFFVGYFHHAAGHVEKYRNTHHYDFSIANRGFDYLIKSIANRDLIWPNRKFVHYQLFSQPSGVSVIDWINCAATLDRDLREMARYFGLGFRAGRPQRVGPRTDYRSYYTNALADIVASTWSREIELFGFKFDEPQSRYAPLELVERVRKARYVLRDDRLIVKRPEPVAGRRAVLAPAMLKYGS